ncbi:MAG: GntR family transcriptional regulator [Sulfobacillus acidophilus]|uniref:GntR family transcriptional regulator n=1 Tax=Sulfobacillus acidophilus TaxID=53633 RepID=A0A2T2WEK2_9FIRM|nr:MAG: GntR family transcriptional regulator [Sulfobacillus acidophilus]
MWFQIDPRLSKPIYLQIVDGVKEACAKHILNPGDRLPSVRELAAEMTLNPNTVAKAYQELERTHVIEVIRGRGTFVAAPSPVPDKEQRLAAMRDTIKHLWIEAQYLQMTSHDLLALMHATVAEWDRERGRERV